MATELAEQLLVNQSVESPVESPASARGRHPDNTELACSDGIQRTASDALHSIDYLSQNSCPQRWWWWWVDEWMEWSLAVLNPLILFIILQAANRYRADMPGGPAPNGIQFFVLPVSISWAFLHAIKIDQLDELDESGNRYRQYVTTGWIARVCCCASTRGAQERRNLHQALPTPALNVHFILLTLAVTSSWPVDGSFAYNLLRFAGMCGILVVCIFLYWFFVKLRIAIVGACKNASELESFVRLARRTVFATIILELILFAKYVLRVKH